MKLLVLLALSFGFTQAWAANKLPTSFSFTGEGVGGNVKVVANVLYSLEQGGVPTPDADKLELLLLKFLDLQTGGGAPGFFTPNLSLYKLTPVKAGEKLWIGRNSSMGWRSIKMILADLEKQLPWPAANLCESFSTEYSTESVAKELIADKGLEKIVPAAENLAAIYKEFRKEGHGYGMNDPLFTRGCQIDSFTGASYHVFFVDRTPYSAPETEVYMVLYTDAYEE
ncbi:MAG: hypothetical protein H6624_08865 [Bdellovibrionaceae bacterium]|nr:hypothetical protein [Bdellovibrionales bacterium]MCB9084444.1 hypothetical protein [Pseudobdellovibrionaceae bacterium]